MWRIYYLLTTVARPVRYFFVLKRPSLFLAGASRQIENSPNRTPSEIDQKVQKNSKYFSRMSFPHHSGSIRRLRRDLWTLS